MSQQNQQDPHAGGPVFTAGTALEEAAGVVVLLHGRGGSAHDILSLAHPLGRGMKLAFVAPQAAQSTWYPASFLAPRTENEPWVSSALRRVETLLAQLGREPSKVVLAGFSQGACLSTEFVATHPAAWAGLIAFTGGLIGPMGADLHKTGQLGGMPALLSSGDPDPHVPWQRVEESGQVLTRLGAAVTLRRYPGKPHSVSAEEISDARELLQRVF